MQKNLIPTHSYCRFSIFTPFPGLPLLLAHSHRPSINNPLQPLLSAVRTHFHHFHSRHRYPLFSMIPKSNTATGSRENTRRRRQATGSFPARAEQKLIIYHTRRDISLKYPDGQTSEIPSPAQPLAHRSLDLRGPILYPWLHLRPYSRAL